LGARPSAHYELSIQSEHQTKNVADEERKVTFAFYVAPFGKSAEWLPLWSKGFAFRQQSTVSTSKTMAQFDIQR
jgi:hypothetical protein